MNVYRTTSLIIVLLVCVSFLRAYKPVLSGANSHTIVDSSEHHQLDSKQTLGKSVCEVEVCDIEEIQEVTREEQPRFVGQEIDNIDSPFTRETVLALNAIVGRSLAVINEFDQARSSAGTSDKFSSSSLLSACVDFSERATSAQADMESASSKLTSSGEQYNEEILSAMVYFVQQVDKEIHDEVEQLRLVQHQ